MTAVTNPTVQTVLGFDALTCLGAGALMIGAAGPLAGLTALPQPLLFWAGVALLPVAALFFAMSRMHPVPQALLWVAVLGNAAWVAASVGVLMLFPASVIGVAFVGVQAATVAALALLEARALGAARPAVA